MEQLESSYLRRIDPLFDETLNGSNHFLADLPSDANWTNRSVNGTAACANQTQVSQIGLSVQIIVPVLYGAITLFGLVGNLLVVLIVLRSRKLRVLPTNVLILNLALSDLIFVITCLPFTSINMSSIEWPFGLFICRLHQFTQYVTVYASVYTLVLMSLDRYMVVVHPITSISLRTQKRTYMVLGAMWAVILATNLPTAFHYEVIAITERDENNCTYVDTARCLNEYFLNDEDYVRNFTIFFFLFAFLIPIVIIICLYAALLTRLVRISKSRICSSKMIEKQRSRRRVTLIVVAVIIVFVICWLPYNVVSLVQHCVMSVDKIDDAFIMVLIVARSLAYLNSCTNPILYAFFSKHYRLGFYALFSAICCCKTTGKLNGFEATTYNPTNHLKSAQTRRLTVDNN